MPHSAATEASEVTRLGLSPTVLIQGGGGVCAHWLKLDDLASDLQLAESHGRHGLVARFNSVGDRLLYPPAGPDPSML